MGNSLGTTLVPDWQSACAAKFTCNSSGLVGINGQPIFPACPAGATISDNSDVWGISSKACHETCGIGTIQQSVDFTTSAITMTTWLLPWLALIAQLPFEAKGWMNLLSGLLALGSPVLATYSLALTAFNRWYAFRKFRHLKEKVQKNPRQAVYGWMVDRLDKASFILVEVQQCPMRANQREGELASLLIINDRDRIHFWQIAHKDLRNTRRGFTYSFLAQVLMAALAYLISFIGAVHDSLGSPDVGLQFASSMVWTWMFPVVYGYIQVGSQDKAGCIKEALTDNKVIPANDRDDFVHQSALLPGADVHLPLGRRRPRSHSFDVPTISVKGPPTSEDDSIVEVDVHSEAYLQASTSQLSTTTTTQPEKPHDHHIHDSEPALPPPTWWGFDIRGDERREGPIFNYARIFTWFAFSKHVYRGFNTAINKFQHYAPIPSTADEAASICDLEPQADLVAFEGMKDISATTIHHILGAALIALFLQWGTTGAAIYVAYQTPSVGLGCRSGSYLLYGIAATVSWLLLLLAHFASHAYMHRLETDPDKHPRKRMSMLGALAVLARLAGKCLAICNAGWIVGSTVLEDIGAFETCWCQTDGLSAPGTGWTPVFKASSDLRAEAGGVWIGGFVWSISVCVLTMGFFAYRQPRS
ncbi:hypothetical protein FB45DRAFT_945812 [Roridomyces roridus]|uniref:Uncharacterized protein n=1 Tax=Roridomyces roridus TaxID=1738132 RepID=A0AAD7B2E9_9AGAR|nr:hypothetical protein FB45DRAFT_945812 [Roridomyces roridus]